METTKLLQRSRQEIIMAWTKVAGEKRSYWLRNTLEVTWTNLASGLDMVVDGRAVSGMILKFLT